MPKVSYPMSVMVGLVGPKVKSTGDTDGYRVNIPWLLYIRYYDVGKHFDIRDT